MPNCERSGTHSITTRQLFCKGCKAYFHRDEMAAGNMVNTIFSKLQNNKRPNYLPPIDESGKIAIKQQRTSEITARDQHISTGKRKAEPETQALRMRHQTWESEADSSWQSTEEEEEEEKEDNDSEEEDDEWKDNEF